MEITFDKAAMVAFTGHRFFDFKRKAEIKAKLTAAVIECYNNGYTGFITGMAVGFDMMAAEVVLSLKTICPDIRLYAAIPFKGQPETFKEYNRLRYESILSRCTEIIVLSDVYYTRCYLDRDLFMMNNCSMVIALYDGRRQGGTWWTLSRAIDQGKRIINVY